jgi:cell division protein FtsQ
MSRKPERAAEPEWDEELGANANDEAAAPVEDADYRRRRQPVRVRSRRGGDWTRHLGTAWRWGRTRGWKPALVTAAVLGVAWAGDNLLYHNPAFVLDSSQQIAVAGAVHTSPARVRQIFAADLGRNIFYIPLSSRQQAIEALPWVKHAAVLRLWPAAIQVRIEERTPVAFARAGDGLVLLDATGVVLPNGASSSGFNFPVLDGMADVAAAHPNTAAELAARQPAMQVYNALRAALTQNGGQDFAGISEIDLAHPDDVVATVTDSSTPATTTLVHLGDRNFAARMNVFFSQIAGWRQKYPNMTSVDLHMDGEAIVDPGDAPPPAAPTRPAHRP